MLPYCEPAHLPQIWKWRLCILQATHRSARHALLSRDQVRSEFEPRLALPHASLSMEAG